MYIMKVLSEDNVWVQVQFDSDLHLIFFVSHCRNESISFKITSSKLVDYINSNGSRLYNFKDSSGNIIKIDPSETDFTTREEPYIESAGEVIELFLPNRAYVLAKVKDHTDAARLLVLQWSKDVRTGFRSKIVVDDKKTNPNLRKVLPRPVEEPGKVWSDPHTFDDSGTKWDFTKSAPSVVP